MNILQVVAASGGWDATQWVALVGVLGATVGPLLGVWLGKKLEKRSQRDAHEQGELLEQTRALKEALAQVELLLPNIDPVFLLKKISAGLPLPDIAAAEEAKSLRAQQEQVDLLLVQASMLSVSEDVQTLLDQLRTSMREEVLRAIGLLAQMVPSAQDGKPPVLEELSDQQMVKLRQLADALRGNLKVALPRREYTSHAYRWARGPSTLPRRPWLESRAVTDWDMLVKENLVRIIETPDILSNLPARPNLMDLSPQDFEALIASLFTKMGYKTALMHDEPDPGVDILAIDQDPLTGGKVVIQVKRYLRPVPAAAVRDLFGVMATEKATKGMLVTTSDFTPAAYNFAKDRPIQLLSGSNVLYLLERWAEIEAQIK